MIGIISISSNFW